MSKFDRKKIAVTLAFASLFSGKTSAMNTDKSEVKSPQSLGAVGGATVSNNNSGANSKTLKRSNSMTGLTRKMGIGTKVAIGIAGVVGIGTAYEILGDTLIDKAPTLLKLIAGDSMKPEEKHALVTKILDVTSTFNTNDIVNLTWPQYESFKSKHESEDEAWKKYKETRDAIIEKGLDKSLADRVYVERYELGCVQDGTSLYNRYRALKALHDEQISLEILNDLKLWDFKNKYGKHDVKEIRFMKKNNSVRIQYNCDKFAVFELRENGTLKVTFNIGSFVDNRRLITDFYIWKPDK